MFTALLPEQLRPGLHEGDHRPGLALSLRLGLLNRLVVYFNCMLQRLYLVDVGGSNEHVPKILSEARNDSDKEPTYRNPGA